ncbi:MAG: hypothetical protein GX366_02105 [Epulopiscium sp.]|nr:hypothetical protein [Candidatus Epulonipiscium sp.]
MKTNKKTILISWFIGLGSGLFVSGIILTLLFYTANNKIDPIEDESTEISFKNDSNIEKKIEKANNKVEQAVKKEEKEEDKGTVVIDIDSKATAKDITRILLEHKVIDNYDDFIAYIVSKDAERKLIHGKKEFPLNADNETVFKILMEYK